MKQSIFKINGIVAMNTFLEPMYEWIGGYRFRSSIKRISKY